MATRKARMIQGQILCSLPLWEMIGRAITAERDQAQALLEEMGDRPCEASESPGCGTCLPCRTLSLVSGEWAEAQAAEAGDKP